MEPLLGPAEIAFYVFLVLFKDGGRRVNPKFPFFFFLMLIKGTKRWGGFKIFLRSPRYRKTLLRSSASC